MLMLKVFDNWGDIWNGYQIQSTQNLQIDQKYQYQNIKNN